MGHNYRLFLGGNWRRPTVRETIVEVVGRVCRPGVVTEDRARLWEFQLAPWLRDWPLACPGYARLVVAECRWPLIQRCRNSTCGVEWKGGTYAGRVRWVLLTA